MKKMDMKKMVSLLAAFCLILSLCAGCGQKEGAGEADGSDVTGADANVPSYMNASGFPITKEKTTVTVFGQKAAGGTEWGDLEVWKQAETLTNLQFKFELAEPNSYKEKKNLALASGDYADILLNCLEVADEETYGPQGTLINMKPLIDKYAPNIKKRMSEIPELKNAATAIDGSIYALPNYIKTATLQCHAAFFNTKWMENVNQKMPVTTDDFYNLLVAFRDKDPNQNGKNDEIPFTSLQYACLNEYLMGAFTGLTGGPTFDVTKDGKVVFTPALSSYKEYLTFVNKLYKEKLLDNDFLTQTEAQWLAKVKDKIVGIYAATPTYLSADTKDLQDCLEPLVSPTNKDKVTKAYSLIMTGRGAITDKCKVPEAVVRLFDMWYASQDEATSDGFYGNSMFIGKQGVTWDYTDATKAQYKFVAPYTNFQDVGKTYASTTGIPCYINFMPAPSGNPLMDMKVNAVKKRQEPYMKSYFPTTARYTKEESEKSTLVETDIKSYVDQMMAKFITGDEPLSNFDKYVDTLKKMKLDELIATKQAVYDRWAKGSK